MRDYELCCEIFNQCSNNQMRDVDFQEVSVEDTDAYIRGGLPHQHRRPAQTVQLYTDLRKEPGYYGHD